MKKKLFILFQEWVPQHLISRFVGKVAQSRRPFIKNTFIKWFVKRYQVNMSEALEENPTAYPHFNDFFTRALKPDAREIDAQANSIVSPADGAISQLGDINLGRIFQAKGHHYGLIHLLGGNAEDAKPYMDGKFMTVYLSPKDYHRVHMPVTGTLKKMIYVPGKLYSVNQTTAESVPELFAKNERVVALFDTEHGPLAMVLVGAMIVASIETTWAGTVAPLNPNIHVTDYNHYLTPITLEKGAEMGRFKLGSTVIMLFGKDAMQWDDAFEAEAPLRMGQKIGTVN